MAFLLSVIGLASAANLWGLGSFFTKWPNSFTVPYGVRPLPLGYHYVVYCENSSFMLTGSVTCLLSF